MAAADRTTHGRRASRDSDRGTIPCPRAEADPPAANSLRGLVEHHFQAATVAPSLQVRHTRIASSSGSAPAAIRLSICGSGTASDRHLQACRDGRAQAIVDSSPGPCPLAPFGSGTDGTPQRLIVRCSKHLVGRGSGSPSTRCRPGVSCGAGSDVTVRRSATGRVRQRDCGATRRSATSRPPPSRCDSSGERAPARVASARGGRVQSWTAFGVEHQPIGV